MYLSIDVKKLLNNLGTMHDYKEVKKKLCFKIVNKNMYSQLLPEVPHKILWDMVILYYFSFDVSVAIGINDVTKGYSKGLNTVGRIITNTDLEYYHITQEELHRDTLISVKESYPIKFEKMSSIMKMEMDTDGGFSENIYVVTVEGNTCGASALAYPDFLEKAAKLMGGNFLLFPSSTYELLIMPEQFADIDMPEYYGGIVGKINDNVVESDIVLSRNAYFYDAKRKKLETTKEYAKRVKKCTADMEEIVYQIEDDMTMYIYHNSTCIASGCWYEEPVLPYLCKKGKATASFETTKEGRICNLELDEEMLKKSPEEEFTCDVVETYRRYGIRVKALDSLMAYRIIQKKIESGEINIPSDGGDYKYEYDIFTHKSDSTVK